MTRSALRSAIQRTSRFRPSLSAPIALQVESNRKYAVKSAQVTKLDKRWYSTALKSYERQVIKFERNSLLKYIGFSEREVVIQFYFDVGGVVLRGKHDMELNIIPPDDFDVVESNPPGERAAGYPSWAAHLISDDGRYLFRARLRNFDAARFDHILDFSIAAVLGVAVGGIMNSYLALILLRRRRDGNQPPKK